MAVSWLLVISISDVHYTQPLLKPAHLPNAFRAYAQNEPFSGCFTDSLASCSKTKYVLIPAIRNERRTEKPLFTIAMLEPRKKPVQIVQPTPISDSCHQARFPFGWSFFVWLIIYSTPFI
ncbi:hypothetical protein BSMD_033270 [Bacillus subtilis Miyagi-4]|nr:hypothetical protein BSNT_06636 [Bacillus subtilis subsp. natto BEST195]GAK81411.1 hypothetical protein BSMD_033270 [Bacillus subtilis Miyagi-4]